MKTERTERPPAGTDVYKWLLGGAFLFIVAGWLLVGNRPARVKSSAAAVESHPTTRTSNTPGPSTDQRWRRRFGASSSATAEQVVTSKVSDFARKRLEWVRAKSLREGKDVPARVETFFAAIQRGDWNEIDDLFSKLAKVSAQYEGSTHDPDLDPFWPAVLEAYGAAEQAHLWPAEKLLEYGDAILGSLRPGMVYVGGTDPGRFIPTLLNETSEGEQHVVLTQNAFADSRYLEYARSLYGEHLVLPTDDDSKRIFEAYVADARQRLEHDQQFPDKPKNLKPGESVQIINGSTSVSGQVAVMAINEKLLQWMLEKNPTATFAVEESFPFKSTYGSAAPLGPIMELRAEEPMGEKDAVQTVEYWRERATSLAESVPSESASDLKTYSKMAIGQANLLASHGYPTEAEATYQLAREMFPRNTEAALGLARFYSDSDRVEDARRILQEFRQKNPDLAKDVGGL